MRQNYSDLYDYRRVWPEDRWHSNDRDVYDIDVDLQDDCVTEEWDGSRQRLSWGEVITGLARFLMGCFLLCWAIARILLSVVVTVFEATFYTITVVTFGVDLSRGGR